MIRQGIPFALVVCMIAVLTIVSGTDPAAAQGFPAGGRGGGRGGMRPQAGAQKSNAPAAQSAADPLANFLGDLHALRAEILVREDQVQRWTAMQDALRAYVELEQESDRQTRNAAIDPLQRLRNLADDTRARADAMQKASASVADMAAALDDHQRQVFGTRLAEALADGTPRAP